MAKPRVVCRCTCGKVLGSPQGLKDHMRDKGEGHAPADQPEPATLHKGPLGRRHASTAEPPPRPQPAASWPRPQPQVPRTSAEAWAHTLARHYGWKTWDLFADGLGWGVLHNMRGGGTNRIAAVLLPQMARAVREATYG